ncbi:hypothetical protein HAX54_017701 [Datura stramonium]|uniref:Uncharacterized protein n=1 Tax=Datura stramonium TaxID=4076 RepID=A0ABS8S0L3_DATST|nr:hypothetical protein [Datura stramonium]
MEIPSRKHESSPPLLHHHLRYSSRRISSLGLNLLPPAVHNAAVCRTANDAVIKGFTEADHNFGQRYVVRRFHHKTSAAKLWSVSSREHSVENFPPPRGQFPPEKNVVQANATESVVYMPFSSGSALEKLCEWGVFGELIEVDAGHDFTTCSI